MKKNITEALKNRENLKLDGSHGAMLIKAGVPAAEVVYSAIKYPEILTDICAGYVDCGCNVCVTATFGISSNVFSEAEEEELISAAINVANKAKGQNQNVYIGLDIGPTGKLVLDDEDTSELAAGFSRQITSALKIGGIDFIFFETFGNLAELKLAYETAKALTDLPIFVSMTFEAGGRSWFGNSLSEYLAFINSALPTAAGINCTLTPKEMLPLIKQLLAGTSVPIIAEPNRGEPVTGKDNIPYYELCAEEYAAGVNALKDAGAHIVGGCCGADRECMALID